MTDHADVPVPQDGLIRADFEMRKAEFAFLVLQHAFDGPACETDVQPGLEFVPERVPDEEPFLLLRVQGIVSPKEVVAAEDLIAATEPKRSRLDLPDQRSFVGVLDVKGDPLGARHLLGMMAKLLDAACRMTRCDAGVVEPTL